MVAQPLDWPAVAGVLQHEADWRPWYRVTPDPFDKYVNELRAFGGLDLTDLRVAGGLLMACDDTSRTAARAVLAQRTGLGLTMQKAISAADAVRYLAHRHLRNLRPAFEPDAQGRLSQLGQARTGDLTPDRWGWRRFRVLSNNLRLTVDQSLRLCPELKQIDYQPLEDRRSSDVAMLYYQIIVGDLFFLDSANLHEQVVDPQVVSAVTSVMRTILWHGLAARPPGLQ